VSATRPGYVRTSGCQDDDKRGAAGGRVGAGDGDRTRIASLEGWGKAAHQRRSEPLYNTPGNVRGLIMG
jgi:hypothetical protein